VVTGYEDRDQQLWSVERCSDRDCQPVYVNAGYEGANRENFHYFWRCRTRGRGDLRIIGASNLVQFASSNNERSTWREVAAGDMLGPGSYVRLGADSEVRWACDAPGGAHGHRRTAGEVRTFRVDATGLRPVDTEGD